MSKFGGIPVEQNIQSNGSRFGGVPVDVIQEEQPSAAMDVTKSVGSNLVGGAIDLAMTLPNLVNTAVAGPQMLGRGIANTMTPIVGKAFGLDAKPQPRGELWQPFYGSADVEKAIGTDYEPETTAGKAVALPSRIIGGIAGAKGIQAAEPKINKIIKDTSSGAAAKAPKTTSDDIRSMANQAYKAADDMGGVLKPSVTNKFLDDVEGLAPQTAEGRMLAGDSAFTKNVEVLKQLRDRPLTLKAAQEIDEILGDKIDDFVDRTTGALSKEGKKLLDVQSSFRKAMDEASPDDIAGGGFDAWKSGKKLWSQAAKLRDVEKIINRAEMTDNPATAIKTGFRNLYTNKARMRGFSQDEAALIKKAAETGVITDALKTLGSRLIPIGASVAGGGFGGTTAALAGSMASRGAATKIQVGRAEKVAEKIAGNAIKKPSAIVNRVRAPIPEGAMAPIINQPVPRQEQEQPRIIQPSTMGQPLPPRSDNFDNSVNFVMDIEGGYVADDAGKGETNMGVNKTANPDVNIKGLTREKAKEVYKKRYWSAIGADKMPPEMALVAFDAAVNHGVGKAKSLIHEANGDPMKLLQLREKEYARLVKADPQKYAQYAQGWIDRLRKLQSAIA